MASQFDLAPRLAELQQRGLKVSSFYQGQPAHWLKTALDGVDVAVVNAKGIRANDTICMITLSTLEALITRATIEHYGVEQKESA